MKLSKRLNSIAESISGVKTVADIGTDHGALPIALVKSGRCEKAIASDINKGPVDIAISRIGRAREAHRIEVRMGNGLRTLVPGEADLIVVAGMGGPLIRDILEASPEIAKRRDVAFILQPNTEPGTLRKWLLDNDFAITGEELVLDAGKFYEIIWSEYTGVRDKDYPGDFHGTIGGILFERRHPLAVKYLEKKYHEALDIESHLSEELSRTLDDRRKNVQDRMAEIGREIVDIKELIKELMECPELS